MGYALSVRSSVMIAHSFKGAQFGPAQQLHGATYVVDCEFRADKLVPGLNWVINIADAQRILNNVLAQYNYKNLDEIEELHGENTTTEYMSYQIYNDMKQRLTEESLCPSGDNVELCVKLSESHVASASYTGDL